MPPSVGNRVAELKYKNEFYDRHHYNVKGIFYTV